jgi:hypothetical protein
MDYSKVIMIEPGKRSGKPCIRGLRITVSDVLDYLARGMNQHRAMDLLEDRVRREGSWNAPVRSAQSGLADGNSCCAGSYS